MPHGTQRLSHLIFPIFLLPIPHLPALLLKHWKAFSGTNYPFTDHAYDYLGLAPLSYTSLDAMAHAIGDSRVYGGIHYKLSCEAGLVQGRKIAKNINNMVKFK